MNEIFSLIIGISICIFILAFTVYAFFENFFLRNRKKIKVKRNGVEITLSKEEYREMLKDEQDAAKLKNEKIKQKESEDFARFNDQCLTLNNQITNAINLCNDRIIKRVLQGIYALPNESKEEYNTKKWLFNDGKLRSNEEVAKHEREIFNAKHRETFDAERHLIAFLSGFGSFTVAFFLIFLLVEDFRKLPIIGIPLSLLPALIAGLIGSAIGHSVNISNAERYGIPYDDDSVRKERLARGIDIAGVAVGTASVIRNTKKATKDIANVDSWKEFK